MQVNNTWLAADTHASKTTKIYGRYNIRHHAGLPVGHPAMTWMTRSRRNKTKYKLDAEIKVTKRFKNPRPEAVASRAK